MNNETQYLASYNLGKLSHVRGRIGWKGLKSHEYTDEGPYLIAGTHIKGDKIQWDECQHINQFRYDESPEIKLNVNDIIISKDGTIGRIALIDNLPGPTTINSTMMLVRLKNQDVLCSEFIFYFLQGEKFKKLVAERVAGSGVPHLFQADMKTLTVLAPSIEKQQKIAKILSTVDNLIDQTQYLIDKYTAVKQGMMADLFSRGIDLSGTPENNKSYGQLRPSYEDAPELYQETEIGWVPLDWTFNQLGSYIEKYLYGPRFDASMYSEYGNVKTIRGTDFSKQGDIKYEQVPLAEIPFPKIRHHILKDGDLVVVTTADCGLTAVYEEQSSDYIPSAYAVKIKLTDDANPYFIKAYMQTFLAETQVNKYVRQGTLGNLPGSDILRFHIALPSLKEQKAMIERLDSIDKLIEKEKQYVEKLKLKKKGLMQDLLTGKVKV
ncbi:restriction endonuclease subunit S [Psychrosphaera haliotis]|uniref:restriction endonuclease subunit S n=1 Tax=Psychrosphaera haliotis TaxID=555083 RepID=UPI0031E2FC05